MNPRTCMGLVTAVGLGVVTTFSIAQEQPAPTNPPEPPAAIEPTVPSANSSDEPSARPVEVPAAKEIQISKPALPPLLDQVVRLSQSGADENVIRAYIEKAAPPYRITGNDIIELRDRGISNEVILSLIDHSKAALATETAAVQSAVTPAPAPPPQTSDVSATGQNEAVGDFYGALAPYGTWINVPEYGLCWQPTVVVLNPDWRPYADYGDWLWSDHGWYWNSYYSWGWAPFHYGRWFSHPRCGWLWYPDRVWGPSWVSWRFSSSFCGWAPLPPFACFTAGLGWTFHGKHVDAHCSFGLKASHFTFVKHDRFLDRHVGRHALRHHEANGVFHRTTVNNHYATSTRNRIINHGVGRETIAAATGRAVGEVSARSLQTGGSRLAASQVTRGESQSAVSRQAVASSSVRHSTAQPMAMARASGDDVRRTLPARVSANTAARVSRPAPVQSTASRVAATPRSASRAMPNYSRAAVSRGAPPARSATTYRQPARPYVRSAPRFQSPPPRMVSRAMPSQRTSIAPRSFSAPRVAAPSFGARAVPRGGGFTSRGSVSRGAVSRSAPTMSRSVGVRR